jgi:hypothetical protein
MLFNPDADLLEMITDFPSELIAGGESVSCFKGERTEEIDFNFEGEYTPETYRILVNSDLITMPSVKDVVTVDDVKFHITSIDENKTGILVLSVRRI